MSRAFVKEDNRAEVPLVPHRAPLPAGTPNYVTARGLGLLREELAQLPASPAPNPTGNESATEQHAQWLALHARRAELELRIGSAVLVERPLQSSNDVRFGACVIVRDAADRERSYRLVGADEADPTQGRIAFFTPLARALLGRAVGDEVQVRTPRGEETLEIVSISYE